MNLIHRFECWERELALFLTTDPSHEEFWSYWVERENAIEAMVRPGDDALVEAAFDRLFTMADAHGFVRLPAPSSRIPRSSATTSENTARDLVTAYRRRAELHRLAMDLTGWITAYNRAGKTYRDFQREYATAALPFNTLLASPDLPPDFRDEVSIVADLIAHFGYDPKIRVPPRQLDDPMEE